MRGRTARHRTERSACIANRPGRRVRCCEGLGFHGPGQPLDQQRTRRQRLCEPNSRSRNNARSCSPENLTKPVCSSSNIDPSKSPALPFVLPSGVRQTGRAIAGKILPPFSRHRSQLAQRTPLGPPSRPGTIQPLLRHSIWLRAKSIFPLSGARFLTLSIPFSSHPFPSVRASFNQASAVQQTSSASAVCQLSRTSDVENWKDSGFPEPPAAPTIQRDDVIPSIRQ